MSVNVNLHDPAVQRLMGTDGQVVAPGAKRELVQLAGDSPDPTGATQHMGLMSTRRLDGDKQEVVVVYKDQALTLDVYALPGEPIEVQYICPRCRKGGRITSEMKAIDFEPGHDRPVRLPDGQSVSYRRPLQLGPGVFMTNAGSISIEPFRCSHELPEFDKARGGTTHGFTLCKLTLAIDNNVAKDA